MTDREKAIVSAYTGIAMLKGDKLKVYYDYLEEIMGRPVQTVEIPLLFDEIQKRSYDDFIKLCLE